jgi:hypothetical protein
LAGPDPPDELRRGLSQKAAHQVQLALALEVAGVTKGRHGDQRCDCGGWIAREQEGEEMPSARNLIAKCEWRRSGAAATVEGKSEKVAGLSGAYLLCKSCSPSRASQRPRGSRTATYTRPPPLTLNDRWARACQSKEWPLEVGAKGGIRTT